MKKTIVSALAVVSLAAAGCATIDPPKELVSARSEYAAAMKSPTAKQNPAGLYDAKKSLDVANQAFEEDPKGTETRDFAYLALRKVELANAKASNDLALQQKQQISDAKAKGTAEALAATKRQLEATRGEMKDQATRTAEEQRRAADELARTNASLEQQRLELEKEKQARLDAEKKAQETQDQLAKIAATKSEARGIVLTLSGSVLFTSNQSTLLAGARTKLDEVAVALQKAQSSGFVVEGHTDSVGNDAKNQELSERRAQTVRDYLVSKGVASEDITAVGYGKTKPIADNTTAEGRANNRRVEIVIKPPAAVSAR